MDIRLPRRVRAWITLIAAIATAAVAPGATADDRRHDRGDARHKPSGPCRIDSADGKIEHVIYIQFDNTHFSALAPAPRPGTPLGGRRALGVEQPLAMIDRLGLDRGESAFNDAPPPTIRYRRAGAVT